MTRFPCTRPGARRAVESRSRPPRNASRSAYGSSKARGSECTPECGATLAAKLAHRLLQIRNQVRRVFYPYVQAHGRPALPLRGRAQGFGERRDREALEAAPAVAEVKKVQRVQHFRGVFPGIFFLEHYAEKP